MSRPATTTGADRLLHVSADRVLFRTTDVTSGMPVVCKLLVTGSLADAEREAELGRAAADAGLAVARYRSADVDAVSGRPMLTLDLHAGEDLDALVARIGAVPAVHAVRLALPVARTLAALHTGRFAVAPHGICHGDVKPGNLLATADTTLLIDFEHARPIPAAGATGRAGMGTTAFTAPEVALGAPPGAALDVFALGATLQWLLNGGLARALPQPAAVRRLIAACTDPEPSRRPSAAQLGEELAHLTTQLAEDPDEPILHRLATGERIEFRGHSEREADLQRLAARQRRLCARLPGMLQPPHTKPTGPGGLFRALRDVQRVLKHFPRHAGALAWRAELAENGRALLAGAAARVGELQRAEAFVEADAWLADAMALARSLTHAPGRRPIPGAADPRAVGLLQRSPLQFLERLCEQLAETAQDLRAAGAAIDAAEERFDLPAAERAIDAMTTTYGGASPTVAQRREQLHRLAFYLDRIGTGAANVDRLTQLWEETALGHLAAFVRECGAATGRAPSSDAAPALGLRSLQVTLVNLVEEFPHLYVRCGPATDALSRALRHVSDLAWELATDARQKLEMVPVPVRPLQTAFARLDTFRILEALIDRPERPRSTLLDTIESLRLKFEQARSTRDRLAQGAEQAMARGHWTTGLFDMERAVAGIGASEGEGGEEVQRLRDRLSAAKAKKREIEAALRRNAELGNRYGMLQDDPASSSEERIRALEQRREALRVLAESLPGDRAALYLRDLDEVELKIALERADLAEQQLDANQDPAARRALAARTVGELEAALATTGRGAEPPGRLVRVVDHWRTVADRCARELDRIAEEGAARGARRRRWRAAITALCTLAAAAAAWATAPRWFGTAEAKARAAEPWSALAARAEALAPTRRAEAAALAEAARPGGDAEAWRTAFAAACAAFADAAPAGPEGDAERAFARDCRQAACEAAATAGIAAPSER